MTSVELRQQRAGIITQMQALHDGAEAEGRDLTPEEATQWDGLKAADSAGRTGGGGRGGGAAQPGCAGGQAVDRTAGE